MSDASSAYLIRKLGERKSRDEARVHAAANRAFTALNVAVSALNGFLLATIKAGHPDDRGAADSRRRLMEDMSECADWLEKVYGRD